MAYVNQEKKRNIQSALLHVVPAGWKYSLAVRNHSTIVMTISAAPFDLLGALKRKETGHASINPYHAREQFTDESIADIFEKVLGALNTGNWDNSDPMTDYYDVGHYVDLQVGRWDKPFQVKPMVDVKNLVKEGGAA